jgi:twinkle protein
LEGEDYDGQKDVMNLLLEFAAKENVHVFLVCHSKKPDARRPEGKHWPAKYDISGSGNISNLAWNVWCVWRNKEKELQVGTAKELPLDDPQRSKMLDEWSYREDALLAVQKQRETGEEPIKRLYFDFGPEGSWQYREVQSDRAKCLVGAG